MKIMKAKPIIVLFMASFFLFPGLFLKQTKNSISGISVMAAETNATPKKKRKTRRTPAMRERVYSQLARAQKLADEGDKEQSMAILNRMKSRSEQMNSYERAMLWNFLGFIHYGNEDLEGAIRSFEAVIAQKNIPESLELSTLFSLAQIAMQSSKYQKALNYIAQWEDLKGSSVNGSALVLKSNAYYAMKQYPQALKAITKAVDDAKSKNKIPKENWLVLKRALHYELKQSKLVTSTSEDLVRLYAKPKYWTELANMYGEIGETRKQLSVLEAAYQQGYVTKRADIRTLAQLYYYAGAPYKAAELMTANLKSGLLEKDVATLRFLAQAWRAAKNESKAIPVLKQAAEISKDGNIDAQLSELYVSLEQWENAIVAAKKAQQKGNLDNPGNIHIALGMSYYNLKVFGKSIEQFQLAKKLRKQQKIAEQWINYVKKEQLKESQLNENMGTLGY